jgi:two-component system KDP operon response regulator KdpE
LESSVLFSIPSGIDWIPTGIKFVQEHRKVFIKAENSFLNAKTKVQALDAGADDCVTKPFGIEELLARVRANLRRAPTAENGQALPIEIGDFRIDLSARKVVVRGREVHLTPKEFDLLTDLAGHSNKVITHRTLLSAIWGGQSTNKSRIFA